ncbi:MAG: 2Fe-2S iron-sulfur cluster-binding protein [Planctomycetota bacterium]
MSDAPVEEKTTVSIVIDGDPVEAEPGDNVLQAAIKAGKMIPHYCWHPGLKVAGNCRMCLVYATKAGPPNKPVIACNTAVVEGMEVETKTDRVKELQEGVMEFLLINHPLDCPVCDQAGECDLQQYSFDYGRESSPFVEEKTQRPRKDLGPLVRFSGNRCIVCTRCVRFCDEVAGTGELSVVNRGEMSWIDTFPGVELDNPISACTVDLCPVGALLDRDSIHTTRPWLLRGTKSVCGGCSTGCNIEVDTYQDEVKRITPRENQAVNKWWMCDAGRLMHHEAQDPRAACAVDGQEAHATAAVERAKSIVASLGGGASCAVLTTGFATNEELFVLQQLAGNGPVGVAYRPEGFTWESQDGFVIEADKNPNREGVRRVHGTSDLNPDGVQSELTAGTVDLLLIHDPTPGGSAWAPELVEAAAKAKHRIVISLAPSPFAAGADVVLPGLHWLEKDGTYVTGRGRLQRLRAAATESGARRPDLELLQELAQSRGLQPRVLSAAGVFRKLTGVHPATFGDATYQTAGDAGVPLPGAEDTVPPAEAQTYYPAGPKSRGHNRANDEQVRIPVHRKFAAGYGTTRGDV